MARALNKLAEAAERANEGESFLGGRSFSSDIIEVEENGALAPEAAVSRLTHRTAPGCTYFVTTKAWGGRAIFRVPDVAEILLECMMRYRDKGAYRLHDFVVMPNHLHLIMTPGDSTTLEKAIQLIKGGSSHEIHRLREHKMEIWQAGYHETTVRDERDFVARRHYVRMNPVVEKLVERPEDWAYSSPNSKFVLDAMPDRLKIVIPA